MMKRREFFQTSTAAAALMSATAASGQTSVISGGIDYYEQRTYQVRGSEKQQLVSGYLEKGLLPALKRLGIGPVGVFTELGDKATPSLHLLITYPSLKLFAEARQAVELDSEYQDAAREYLAAAPADAAFERIQSSLMVAFGAMPRLMAPKDKPQVFEWRVYESATEAKARAKIEMFNSGEIPIFIEAGFQPVLFGEALIGANLPNLGYLLASSDMKAHEAHWAAFVANRKWEAMKDLPQYKDTVSKVTNLFLTPTPYSEI